MEQPRKHHCSKMVVVMLWKNWKVDGDLDDIKKTCVCFLEIIILMQQIRKTRKEKMFGGEYQKLII